MAGKRKGFPGDSVVKNPPANEEDAGSIPVSGRSIPWRRKWLPTPILLLGKSHEELQSTGSQRAGQNLATEPQGKRKTCKTEQFALHCSQVLSQGARRITPWKAVVPSEPVTNISETAQNFFDMLVFWTTSNLGRQKWERLYHKPRAKS